METNPYASPLTSTDAPRLSPNDRGAWRQGNLLVVSHDATFPDRCVKCNAPVDGRRMRLQLSYYPPIVAIGIFLGPIPLLLMAWLARKDMTVNVGVCDDHRQRRRDGRSRVFLGVAISVLLIFVGVVVRSAGGLAILFGLIVLVGTWMYGRRAMRIVWPKRIDKRFAWLQGVSPEFLAELPEVT